MSSPDLDRDADQQEARITIQGTPGPLEARGLRDAALAALAASGDVTVDCAAVEHLHAAVLQVLLGLDRELRASGRRVLLTNVPPAVERFLVAAGAQRLSHPEAPR